MGRTPEEHMMLAPGEDTLKINGKAVPLYMATRVWGCKNLTEGLLLLPFVLSPVIPKTVLE